jgi:hypothetical protein
VNGFADTTTPFELSEQALCLSDEDLDRLLKSLAQLDLRDAEAVAGQIAALRLAGGVIGLTPTEAEIAALVSALSVLAADARPLGPALMRLASICTDNGIHSESGSELGEALTRGQRAAGV